jgi:hypothetical protein
MGQIFEQKITNFSGGMSDDSRQPLNNVGSLIKHFNIFDNPYKLTPYRSTEVDTATNVSSTDAKLYDIRNFQLGSDGKLYALGKVVATSYPKVVKKTDPTTGNWLSSAGNNIATAEGEGNGARILGAFIEWQGSFWFFQGTTQLAKCTLAGTITNTVATVGTITSGTWSGTALTWAKGGNASTSLSINQVLLGNTTSGFKTVTGWGTNGQFLTSAGAGAASTWTTSAVSLSENYAWTGTHTWSATAFMATTSTAGLTASSTAAHPITLNTVAYTFPTAQNASSSCLMTNNSGSLSWNYENPRVLLADGTVYTTSGTGTTTVTIVVPAGTMGTDDSLEILMLGSKSGGNGNGYIDAQIGTGAATTTLVSVLPGIYPLNRLAIDLFNNDSNSVQTYFGESHVYQSTVTYYTGAATVNTANQFYITFKMSEANAGDAQSIKGLKVLLYRK